MRRRRSTFRPARGHGRDGQPCLGLRRRRGRPLRPRRRARSLAQRADQLRRAIQDRWRSRAMLAEGGARGSSAEQPSGKTKILAMVERKFEHEAARPRPPCPAPRSRTQALAREVVEPLIHALGVDHREVGRLSRLRASRSPPPVRARGRRRSSRPCSASAGVMRCRVQASVSAQTAGGSWAPSPGLKSVATATGTPASSRRRAGSGACVEVERRERQAHRHRRRPLAIAAMPASEMHSRWSAETAPTSAASSAPPHGAELVGVELGPQPVPPSRPAGSGGPRDGEGRSPPRRHRRTAPARRAATAESSRRSTRLDVLLAAVAKFRRARRGRRGRSGRPVAARCRPAGDRPGAAGARSRASSP